VILDLRQRYNQKHLKHAVENNMTLLLATKASQTDLLGLSLSTGRGNWSGWFCPGNPQKIFETKAAPKHLKNLSTFEQEKP
jgi:hypothetical protein